MATDIWEMSPQQLAETFGPYLHETTRVPRPEIVPGAPASIVEMVAVEQGQWDLAETERLRAEAMAAENQARRDREAQVKLAALVQEDAERRTAEQANVEAIVRGRYMLAAGATEEAWERNRERLVDREIERMSVAVDQ